MYELELNPYILYHLSFLAVVGRKLFYIRVDARGVKGGGL